MDKFIIAVIAINIITFVLYGIDKLRAKRNAWRISEKVLLGFGVISGGIGGILGMLVFRHKTKHFYFWLVNLLGIALALVTAIYMFL